MFAVEWPFDLFEKQIISVLYEQYTEMNFYSIIFDKIFHLKYKRSCVVLDTFHPTQTHSFPLILWNNGTIYFFHI